SGADRTLAPGDTVRHAFRSVCPGGGSFDGDGRSPGPDRRPGEDIARPRGIGRGSGSVVYRRTPTRAPQAAHRRGGSGVRSRWALRSELARAREVLEKENRVGAVTPWPAPRQIRPPPSAPGQS